MSKAKRVFIVSDITYNPVKMFLNQTNKFAKGFIRLGRDVRVFSYRNALFYQSPIKSKTFAARFFKSKTDQLLADQIKNYQPDIVFVIFPRVFDADTVLYIRRVVPDAVFIGYDGDFWPKLQKGSRIETAKKLDIVLATNDGRFLQDYRDAQVPVCHFIPNLCDADIEHRYEVNRQWKADILWTGKPKHKAYSGETFREELVNRLAEQQNVRLYGCLGRPKIGGIDYLYAISGAKIGLSVNAINTIRLYHSDRFLHYLACGTFVLAKRVPDTDLLFEDGVHLRYFDTVDEFFDLAEWYLNHEDERIKIADAGMRHAHTEFNCEKIAKYILDIAEYGSYSAPWTS